MKTQVLQKVALRNQALLVSGNSEGEKTISKSTFELVENMKSIGFTFSEKLLRALNTQDENFKKKIYDTFQEVLGTNLNWTPLVKNWKIQTGETREDHIITFIANIFGSKSGYRPECGCLIPYNTFPIERYNGCPFCGTPFRFGEIEFKNQGSKLKVLDLWTEENLNDYFQALLSSKTALDATQIDSLKILIKELELPETEIKMKETAMTVIDSLVENGKDSEAICFLKTPTDILRYLWYKKTGFLQIIEPKTIINRTAKNNQHLWNFLDTSIQKGKEAKYVLKLKYSRKECKMVANWLNNLEQDAKSIAENMHPKRSMWVRFIRALRLTEYGKKPEFSKLAEIMDVFYNQNYEVWQGKVNHFRLKQDSEKTFELLKQRPGLFARSLFSNMLWLGEDITLEHFDQITDKIPMRLLLTLNMYAPLYFDKEKSRTVKTLGGTHKTVPANQWVSAFENEHLKEMVVKIENLTLKAVEQRFAKEENENKTIFIDENLYNIPLSIGDRSDSVQDLPSALQGTKFPLEGNQVRLFMQWGKDLPKQHLDMDLSCHVAYDNRTDFCSFSNLTTLGCQHSGDIRSIPDYKGTAEYINIDVDKLQKNDAKFVTFTCNAYSNGSITPNLVVGWMDSKYPMSISEKSGVAYDPSCVIHQVRVTQNVAKGLVFGVLDVEKREIIWLEMSFQGQTVHNLGLQGVKNILAKLDSKTSIGNLLEIKAKAQGLEIVDNKGNADEIYDAKWALDSAKVTQLFVD